MDFWRLHQTRLFLSFFLTSLLALTMTGCGGSVGADSASNDWVVYNPDTQSPDETQSIITNTKELVFAGTQIKDGQGYSLLTRYNLQGSAVWEATEIANSGFQAVTEDNTDLIVGGGIVSVDGFNTSFSNPFVAKYDQHGTPIWTASLGEFEYTGLQVDTDAVGNTFVLTHLWQRVGGAYHVDYVLAKFDTLGAPVWQKDFRLEYQSYSPLFRVDSLGNSYLAYTRKAPRLIKFDATGEQEWLQEMPLDGSTVARIQSLNIDTSDHAIVHTGSYKEVLAGFIPSSVAATFAYDGQGNTVWEYHLPDPAVDVKLDVTPQGMTIDADGNYYLTHSSSRQDFAFPCQVCAIYTHRVYVTKLSPIGEEIWHQEYKTNGNGTAGASVAVNDSFIAMADDGTLRTFRQADGSIVIEQDTSEINRELSHVLLDEEDHIFFVTDAGNGFNNFYSIEKWIRELSQP